MKQKDMPHFRDEVFAPPAKEEVQQEEEQFAREAPVEIRVAVFSGR